jgi:2'-phosphotransferase
MAASDIPDMVVHGTNYPAWEAIRQSGGLLTMGRNHIHFAAGIPERIAPLDSSSRKDKKTVISGMRSSANVLIYIDMKKAMDAGLKFWKSDNEVILTEGDDNGKLSIDYFTRVEDRKNGLGVLWENGELVKELPSKLKGRGFPTRKGAGLGAQKAQKGKGNRGGRPENMEESVVEASTSNAVENEVT